METYNQLKTRQQEEVNKLPLYFAFGEDQWKRLLNELGLTEENCREHLVNYHMAIVRKVDIPKIDEVFNRHTQELAQAMRDIEFFKDAVLYEMRNHEYGINWQGDYDVLNALGYNVRYSDGRELYEVNMPPEFKKAYSEVRSKYYSQYGDDL